MSALIDYLSLEEMQILLSTALWNMLRFYCKCQWTLMYSQLHSALHFQKLTIRLLHCLAADEVLRFAHWTSSWELWVTLPAQASRQLPTLGSSLWSAAGFWQAFFCPVLCLLGILMCWKTYCRLRNMDWWALTLYFERDWWSNSKTLFIVCSGMSVQQLEMNFWESLQVSQEL